MIIKSKTRKNRSFKQAIGYVLREEAQPIFVIKHNIEGDTPSSWIKSFQDNENDRKRHQKNNVKIIHLILSWHQYDSQKLSDKAMKEMTRHFMQLYCPHAAYIAVAHPAEKSKDDSLDPEHKAFEDNVISTGPHVHIIAGGVDRFGRSLRISKARFRSIKKTAEEYQATRYPELIHSKIDHNRSGLNRNTEAEYWMKRRSKKTTRKQKVFEVLHQTYQQAHSTEHFGILLEQAGLETYTRGGKIVGIIYQGYKHRFRLFGYTKEKLLELDERSHDQQRSR